MYGVVICVHGQHGTTVCGVCLVYVVQARTFINLIEYGVSFSILKYKSLMVFSHHHIKTTTRQMLNLCIPMMPFTSGATCLV